MSKSPERTITFGNVSASIFVNEGENNSFRSVSLSRSYRDGDGERKYASSFSLADISAAIDVLEEAKRYLIEKEVLSK